MNMYIENANLKATQKTHVAGAARVESHRPTDWPSNRPSKVKLFKFDKKINMIKKDLKCMTNRLHIFCSTTQESAQENQEKNKTRTYWEGKMKYKLYITAILTVGLLAATGLHSEAQLTAVTKSFGYLELTNTSGEVVRSLPFQRRGVWRGRVASFSGNTITVQGSPGWSTNQFVFNLPTRPNHFYAIFRDGALEGEHYDIISNGSNTITLNVPNLVGLSVGDPLEITPKWNLLELFPSNQGIYVNSDPFQATNIRFFQPNSVVSNTRVRDALQIYHNGTNWRRTGPNVNFNYRPLNLTEAYTIDNNGLAPTIMIAQGWVEDSDVAVSLYRDPVNVNSHVFGIPRPTVYTLSQMGFVSNSNVISYPSHTIFNSSAGDHVRFFDNTITTSINVALAPRFWVINTVPVAWRRENFPPNMSNPPSPNTTNSVLPGTAVMLVRAPGTAVVEDLIIPTNY